MADELAIKFIFAMERQWIRFSRCFTQRKKRIESFEIFSGENSFSAVCC